MLRAYADDLAIVAKCFQDICSSLAPVFKCVQQCASLALNAKKCVLVPFRVQFDETEVKEWLYDNVPDWANLCIQSYGKYLGFFIGPGGVHKEWDKVMKKLMEASTFVKKLGLSKFQAFQVFHIFGYSQIQFAAQLRNPCRALRRVELQNIRDIIGGPGLWAPAEVFYHLKSNRIFPLDLKAYDTLCMATMAKTAIETLSGWEQIYEELSVNSRDDDDGFIFPFQNWWNNLGVVCLKRASDQLADVDVQGHGRLHLQSYLYSALLQCMHPNPLHTVLYDKLGRWIDADHLDGAVEHATKVLEMIHKSVPPCVRFCVWTAWCNAWCTSARFQGEGLCRLCGECSGADSLEHYAVCHPNGNLLKRSLACVEVPIRFCDSWDLMQTTQTNWICKYATCTQ